MKKAENLNARISKNCTIKICFMKICSIVICKCCRKLKSSKCYEFLSFVSFVCLHFPFTYTHIHTHTFPFSTLFVTFYLPFSHSHSLTTYTLIRVHICKAARIKRSLIFIYLNFNAKFVHSALHDTSTHTRILYLHNGKSILLFFFCFYRQI